MAKISALTPANPRQSYHHLGSAREAPKFCRLSVQWTVRTAVNDARLSGITFTQHQRPADYTLRPPCQGSGYCTCSVTFAQRPTPWLLIAYPVCSSTLEACQRTCPRRFPEDGGLSAFSLFVCLSRQRVSETLPSRSRGSTFTRVSAKSGLAFHPAASNSQELEASEMCFRSVSESSKFGCPTTYRTIPSNVRAHLLRLATALLGTEGQLNRPFHHSPPLRSDLGRLGLARADAST